MDPIIEHTGHLGKKCGSWTVATLENMRRDADHAAACANKYIRKRPLPVVAGAVVFGVAVGCLIMSGRDAGSRHPTVSHAIDDARDAISHISHSLGRVLADLKFW